MSSFGCWWKCPYLGACRDKHASRDVRESRIGFLSNTEGFGLGDCTSVGRYRVFAVQLGVQLIHSLGGSGHLHPIE